MWPMIVISDYVLIFLKSPQYCMWVSVFLKWPFKRPQKSRTFNFVNLSIEFASLERIRNQGSLASHVKVWKHSWNSIDFPQSTQILSQVEVGRVRREDLLIGYVSTHRRRMNTRKKSSLYFVPGGKIYTDVLYRGGPSSTSLSSRRMIWLLLPPLPPPLPSL